MSDGEILQRFTPSAIRVVQHAKEEARRYRGNTVGSEHVLLGLIREQGGVAARVLERLGVSLGRAQNELRRQMDMMETHAPGQTSRSWSAGARRVLELALDEARELNLKFVDTEHLLLGMLRDPDSPAVGVLRALGAAPEQVRAEVIKMLGGAAEPAPPVKEQTEAVRRIDVNTRFGYNPQTGVTTTPAEVKRAGQLWGVETAYTFSLNAAIYSPETGNQETLDLCASDGFFRPVAVLSPTVYRPLAALERVKQQGFALVRIFPELHSFTVDGQACRDLLTACGVVGLPVMIPALAAGAANLLRGVEGVKGRFVLTQVRYANLGEVVALAGRLPDLYVEISGVNTPDGLAMLAEAFGSDRLLFGSDYPNLQVGCAAMLLGGSGLTGLHVDRIAFSNARRLLEAGE